MQRGGLSMRNKFELFLLAAVLAANAFGQAAAINGEITGTVTDPSGAAVAGATVNVTNTDTGYKLTTKTADSGLYRLTLLPLGAYEIDVQAAGFAAAKRTGIPLMAGQTATVDVRLSVAGTATSVDVVAAASI